MPLARVAADLLEASQAALADADIPDGGYRWVEAVETLSPQAEPLPRTVFDGPRDRRFAATDDRTGITEVARP